LGKTWHPTFLLSWRILFLLPPPPQPR
jgi:hypothetical protein